MMLGQDFHGDQGRDFFLSFGRKAQAMAIVSRACSVIK